MLTKLWLDDARDPRDWLPAMGWFRDTHQAELEEWLWVRTAPEAIASLEAGGVSEISLDHDLGDEESVGTGYEVLLWIEERTVADDRFNPPLVHIHTSNISARDRMESAARAIESLVARRRQ